MAHVEAPVSGSMILAGVLLKLGGYGLLRVFPVLFKFGFRFGVIWVALTFVGGLFVSLFCIRQTDLKSGTCAMLAGYLTLQTHPQNM
jgi:NADH-ubiquinone oxidoreductase chain 4